MTKQKNNILGGCSDVHGRTSAAQEQEPEAARRRVGHTSAARGKDAGSGRRSRQLGNGSSASCFPGVVGVLATLLLAVPAAAFAAETPTLNAANTAWMLTSTALVLFMTLPGLALFYGGLVRTKNVLSVLMQCFAITGVVSIVWVLFAYSLAFGDGGESNAWIGGLAKSFLAGVGVNTLKGNIPETVFAMFQMTFAIITPALVVGGFAERMRFSSMLFSLLWLLLVYVPVCHWGDGWLQKLGVMDFAGGTVVHINAGVAALVARWCSASARAFRDRHAASTTSPWP